MGFFILPNKLLTGKGKYCGRECKDKHQTIIYSGDNNPVFGKKHTNESKNKVSTKAKERFSKKENHPSYGKPCSEETKEKIRVANTGRKMSEET